MIGFRKFALIPALALVVLVSACGGMSDGVNPAPAPGPKP